MGNLTHDYTILATNAVEVFSLPVDNHYLTAASIYAVEDTQSSNDIWTEIVLLGGGNTRQNIMACLASGYVGALASNFWSGRILCDQQYFVGAVVQGTINEILRLSVMLELP